MGKRRVVITGLGAITPLGNNVRETWSGIIEGRSGAGRITLFDASDCPVRIAAEVKDFDPARILGPLAGAALPHEPSAAQAITKESKKMGRFTQFATAAALEAYLDAGLPAFRANAGAISPERIGVHLSAGMGGLPEIEAVHNDFLVRGYRRITPYFITQSIPNMPSGQLSIMLDLRGPNLCTVSACASSAHGLGEAMRHIGRGDVDIVISGGAEAVICKLGIGGFAAMRALSARNDAPCKASRPFDRSRDGFLMGEGAAALVLEEYEHARARGAKILAEVKGYGASAAACHITAPSPGGEGGARAMKIAIQEAGINADRIGYVNAHGTATPTGDTEEARAVAAVFPDAKKHLHISSTKSMTGHLLGGAGALEAMLTILAMNEGIVPATINLDDLDPDCAATGLDFTANKPVRKNFDHAMSNSFGFGGTNASLVFGKI